MYIHQITVFLENMKGTLSKLTTLLADNGIDILAMSIADTSGFGLVRFIVREKDNDECLALLKQNGYSARKNHVICARVPNEAGGLNKILCLLDAAGISIEYLYSFNYSEGNNALIIFRLSDREAGLKIFSENGISVFSQTEINSIQ